MREVKWQLFWGWGLISLVYLVGLMSQRQLYLKPIDWNELIGRYFLSQDITNEVNGKRLFLSDSEIHQAAGYLYQHGSDPTKINFQHPPLIKYLYGYSGAGGGNAYVVQAIFGYLLLGLTVYLGYRVYQQALIPIMAGLALALDPLFRVVTTELWLDLGQAVLILLYWLGLMFYPKNFWWHGLVLGCLLGSKFWGSSLFFIGLFGLVLILRHEFNLKNYLKQGLIAIWVLGIIYLPAFIYQGGRFNLIWFQLKLLKYWWQHSVAVSFGAASWLFLTGKVTSWWGNLAMIRPAGWSWLWPVALTLNLFGWTNARRWRQPTLPSLIMIIPGLYLIYLTVQAPFIRYYLTILPFLYLGASEVISHWIRPRTNSRASL